MPSDLYRFVDGDDHDLKRILDASQIDLPQKLYSRAEVKLLKTGAKTFMWPHDVGTFDQTLNTPVILPLLPSFKH